MKAPVHLLKAHALCVPHNKPTPPFGSTRLPVGTSAICRLHGSQLELSGPQDLPSWTSDSFTRAPYTSPTNLAQWNVAPHPPTAVVQNIGNSS